MQAIYASRKKMAQSYRLKRTSAAPAFRQLQGRRVSRVAKARKDIMERKVYQRSGNPDLTRNLISSERIRFRGNVAAIENTAPYAEIRDNEEGISRQFGHDKELHFARGAVEETREENAKDARLTLRQIMAAGRNS